MTYFRRRTPEWWEELAAGAAGAAAGFVAWYVARTLLSRDELSGHRTPPGTEGPGEGRGREREAGAAAVPAGGDAGRPPVTGGGAESGTAGPGTSGSASAPPGAGEGPDAPR